MTTICSLERSDPVQSTNTAGRPCARRPATARARGALAAAAAAAAVLVGAPAGWAQNIVPNGRFDDDVAPFQVFNAAVQEFDANLDRGGPSGSGSLKLTNVNGQAPISVGTKTCISGPIAPGGYYFEYWLRFATGDTANGTAQVSFATYPSADCTGQFNGLFFANPIGPAIGRGLWVRLQGGDITQAAGTVPPGTNSLLVSATLGRKTGSSITANFDGLFLAPVGKPLCQGRVPTIGGKDLDDVITGTSGPDVIVALGGDDTVYAGGGNDVVCGGTGDDTLFGEDGNDRLFGQGGADELFGDAGDDLLKGGPGADTLAGGVDFDRCLGGGATDSAFSSCDILRSVP